MLEDAINPYDIAIAREYFKGDRFATDACGAVIDEVGPGYAVVSCKIGPHLFNAQGGVMGGAIFTLADFALAIASNLGQPDSVAISNSINYFTVAKGERLIARAETERAGRHLAYFTISITDELGTNVGKMQAVCSRVGKKH
jgi:acyl-CoA thioesterase